MSPPPPLRSHARYDYQGITAREAFTWPQGRKLAVYLGLNLEHFAFGEGLGGELAPGGPMPDILNYAWRDYGNRVGVWRMLELFDDLQLPVSLLVNSSIYAYCPEVVTAFSQRGDEIIGHGRTNSERQGVLSEADERTLIEDTSRAIEAAHGQPPRGWLGPWISQSEHTPDLLQEAGYEYLLDWCHDDQPTWFKTRNGRILSVPYPQEINDIPAVMVRRASAREFGDMIIDNFDEMLRQSRREPLVMGIALHAYIMGQPFRIKHLRRALEHIRRVAATDDSVWLCTSGDIAREFSVLSPA